MNGYTVMLAGVIVVGVIVVVVAWLFRSGWIRASGEFPGKTCFKVEGSRPAPSCPALAYRPVWTPSGLAAIGYLALSGTTGSIR